tara:strand:- start:66 stop:983 length:918 start_codon:yes stop_codon:yes gene_type:complete
MKENIFTHDVKPVKMYREITNEDGSTGFDPIHGFHAVERTARNNPNDNGDVVYVHPASYYPIQLEQLEEIAHELVKCGYEITGSGELKNNRLAFIELENDDLPNLSFDGTTLNPKMWIGTSHDGSVALKSTIKVVDTWCANTFMLNSASDILFKAKHTRNSSFKIQDYQLQIRLANDTILEYYDLVNRMQDTDWHEMRNKREFANVLGAKMKPRSRTKRGKQYWTEPNYSGKHANQLIDLDWAYHESPGQVERGDTAWRWFSAVTYWADHMISDRELEAGSNILSGTRARQKAKAFEIAKNYIVG